MSGSHFHLLAEPDGDGAAPRPALVIPDGVSYLTVGDEPILSAEQPAEPAFVLEPVKDGVQSHLLLLSPTGVKARVNGQAVPRVALLSVKDQLCLENGPVLHVTRHHTPHVGPPPAAVVGQECVVCRTPFAADTTVYVCPSCGLPLHAEGDDGLDCVRLGSECPSCRTPVVTEAGYAYVPE